MALIEVVALAIGPAIAKAIIKSWLGDGLPTTIAGNSVDLLKRKIEEILTQNKSEKQIERIGQQVALRMYPMFEHDGARLDEQQRSVVAYELADTLTRAAITSELLIELNLDSQKLAQYIESVRADATRLLSEGEAALYRRLVIESAKEIVGVTTQLSGFERYFSASVLQETDEILAGIAKLLARPTQEAAQFESKYRSAIKQNLDRVEVFGVPQLDTLTRRQSLSVAYITLDVNQREDASSQHDADADSPEEHHPRKIARYGKRIETSKEVSSGPADQLLTASRRVVVRGQAGSGKSTLMQWIAVRSAAQDFPPHLSHLNDTVPFFIRLRSCVKAGFPKTEEFPAQVAAMIAGDMPAGWVHDQLESGRAIVLVDGVDELPREQRDVMLEHLKQLVSSYRLAFYIVTSRPAALKSEEWSAWQEWTKQEGFVEASLEAMSGEQADNFIDHWHIALERSLSDDEERKEVQSQPASLKRLLRQRPPLRRLASNPLLCSMICALHRERQQNLPAERISLYKACIDMLLSRRDEGRKINLPDYPNLNNDQKLVLIQSFAYWLMLNGYSDVEFAAAEKHFEGLLPGLDLQDVKGESIRRLFVQRTSLLREPVAGRIDFTHRTFQEFLAAQAALNADHLGVLLQKCRDDQWRETIILAAGEARPKECEKLLRGLIVRADRMKLQRNRSQIYSLALACLETSILVPPAVRSYVLEKASSVFPPKDEDEAKMVAAAGDPAVPFLVPREKSSTQESVSCVNALAFIGTDRAMTAIEEYTVDTRPPVVFAIGQARDRFDQHAFTQRVLAKMHKLWLPKLPTITDLPYLTQADSLGLGSIGGDFNVLKEMTSLRELDLARTEIDDLSPLIPLTNLEELIVSNTEVSDLSPLASLTQLTSLNLAYSNVSDLGPLAGLTELSSLTVFVTAIRDLSPLAKLAKLTQLWAFETRVSDLGPLANLTNLELLYVGGTQISDLTPLSTLTNLAELSIWYCNVSDLGPLANLTNMTLLQVPGNKINDLRPLEKLTKLTTLHIGGTSVSDFSLLQRLTNLRDLDVGLSQVSDLSFLASLPELRTLDISDTSISDLSPLMGLKKLVRLDISHTSISDLSPLAHLTRLRELRVSDSAALNLGPLAKRKDLSIERVSKSS